MKSDLSYPKLLFAHSLSSPLIAADICSLVGRSSRQESSVVDIRSRPVTSDPLTRSVGELQSHIVSVTVTGTCVPAKLAASAARTASTSWQSLMYSSCIRIVFGEAIVVS